MLLCFVFVFVCLCRPCVQERLGHLSGAEEAMTAIGYLPQGEYLRLDEKRLHSSENEATLKTVDLIAMAKLNELKKAWAVLPARTQPTHAYKCVQAVGCHSAIGKRHNMEDDEIMVDSFCGVETQGYFGLYDGHGGRATVDFVVKALHIVRTNNKLKSACTHARTGCCRSSSSSGRHLISPLCPFFLVNFFSLLFFFFLFLRTWSSTFAATLSATCPRRSSTRTW